MHIYPLYINGEFKETQTSQDVINPSSGEALAQVSVARANDIDLALACARDAFDHGEWPRLPLAKRKEFILKISQGILENAAELSRLESENAGKPIKETTFMDVPSSAKSFEHFAQNLEKYLASESLEISQEASQAEAHLVREPRGVVVLIVPWNYPLLIAAWKMSQALAAGNTVILKPSSLTPLTALALAKIIHSAGLPKGVVNIINASGDTVGEALCSDKRADMVSFTGSNEVGKKIIQYSAKSVKKLTMELGGKSAAIVLKDVDIGTTVNSLLCAVFLNQGQMCTAMSRIFIDQAIYEKFTSEFIEKVKRIKLGPALDFETQMGPLISDTQRKKVLAFVEKARAEGAKVLCGGKISADPKLKSGFFFEPTVLTGVSKDAQIFQEEVFGPVVCLAKFSHIQEAIDLANASNFGLAASVWSSDAKVSQEIAAKINSGTCWINTYGMFYNEAPYGGFKQSGFGKELGKEGFLEYTRLKNIIQDKSSDAKPIVSYWYGF
ncbi:MAG: aldehyde dehydrogenase family protein [Candidatus Omnitrophica bacterium]|nr:aldehyde dehydrogenase family protein [Candidatus Omnitrophota bacterium]MDD5236597.1 aldehyde dehydrogenase family protein [Candidatus Omnitrophota bacterium]MDD5610725.1 aldehyde dehydrogenase family protein [Candidatus Omnitrophota bacterium]